MCFGTAGLDPALEGYTDEGLELLVSGTGGGSGANPGAAAAAAAAVAAAAETTSPILLPLSPRPANSNAAEVEGGFHEVNGDVQGLPGGLLLGLPAGKQFADQEEQKEERGEGSARVGGESDVRDVCLEVNGGNGCGDGNSGGGGGGADALAMKGRFVGGVDMEQFDADSVGGSPEVRRQRHVQYGHVYCISRVFGG